MPSLYERYGLVDPRKERKEMWIHEERKMLESFEKYNKLKEKNKEEKKDDSKRS